LSAPVVGLAHRKSELAVVLDSGEWMLVWEEGRSLGTPLPGRSKLVTLASDEETDNGALWAIGAVHGGMNAVTTRVFNISATRQGSTWVACHAGRGDARHHAGHRRPRPRSAGATGHLLGSIAAAGPARRSSYRSRRRQRRIFDGS